MISRDISAVVKLLTAVAHTTEDLGVAVGQLARAGSNFTSSASMLLTVSLSSTVHLASTVWRGVDLLRTQVHHCQGQLITDDPERTHKMVLLYKLSNGDFITQLEVPFKMRQLGLFSRIAEMILVQV